jgi:hypothetical protein
MEFQGNIVIQSCKVENSHVCRVFIVLHMTSEFGIFIKEVLYYNEILSNY